MCGNTNIEELDTSNNILLTCLNIKGDYPIKKIKFGKLEKLIELHGSFSDSIPDDIGYTINLLKLYIEGGSFTELPVTIGNLINLESIFIIWSKLTKFPVEIANLKKLKLLSCIDGKLNEIQDEIGELDSLQKLDFSHNNISYVSDNISKLPNIESINCNRNKLTEFPQGILNNKNLVCFNADDNEINIIPKDFYKMTNLQILSLVDNNIMDIPLEIFKCKKLHTIHTHFMMKQIKHEQENNIFIERYIYKKYYDLTKELYKNKKRYKKLIDNEIIYNIEKFDDITIDKIIELLNDDYTIDENIILEDINIKNRDKLKELFESDIYNDTVFCTFKELFIKVYKRIVDDNLYDKLNNIVEVELGSFFNLINIV